MAGLSGLPRDSFIDADEYAYFTSLAKTHDGETLIVDARCFAGSSTKALCEGASLSRTGLRRQSVVAIDRFLVMDQYIAEHFAAQGVDLRFGESFLSIFMGNLTGHLDKLDVRPGELTQVGRIETKIGILAIDIAKTPALNAYILREWFKHLIPGTSIVLHQDFHAPSQPWLAISMGGLLDYFEIELECVGETASFRLVEPIPMSAIQKTIATDWLSPQGLHCLDRISERFSAERRSSLLLIKALVLRRMRRLDEAAAILESLLELNPQPSGKKWRQWFSMALATIDPSVFDPRKIVAELFMEDANFRLGHWH